MSTLGFVIGLAGIILGLVYIFWPLVIRAQASETQIERARLNAEYAQIVHTIRELDDDHHHGKVAPHVYAEARDKWLAQGTRVLQALDALPTSADERKSWTDEQFGDHIEAEIERYRFAQAGN